MGRNCFRVMALFVAFLLTAGCVTVSVHAEASRDWGVYSMAENENGIPEFKTPPAYEYTDQGLRVTPSEGMDSYTVQSEQVCSLDEGFFMELKLENMALGNMLLLHVWDQSGVMIGNLHCGSGWYCLIAVDKGGNDYMMSLRLWESNGGQAGGSEILGTKGVKTEVSEGTGRYTLALSEGALRVNGSAVPGSEEALAFLREKTSDGQMHVGMTVMTTDVGQALSPMTMTRFGRDEATATIVGTNVIPETTPPSADTTPAEPDSDGPVNPDPTDTTTPDVSADTADTTRPEQDQTGPSGDSSKPADPDESRPNGENTDGGESRPAETDEFGNYRDPDETETRSTADRLATVYGEAFSICHSSVGANGVVCVAIMGAAFAVLRKKH